MKIRSGFVSNSSSSSFIVAFDKKPKSVEEMKEYLFGHNSFGNIDWYEESMSVDEVSEIVFRDLEEQRKPLSEHQIVEELCSGYLEQSPDFWSFVQESRKFEKEYREKHGKGLWDSDENPDEIARNTYRKIHNKEMEEYEKARTENAQRVFQQIKGKFKGKKVYRFVYGDECGQGLLEHGEIFSNVPHYQISHH